MIVRGRIGALALATAMLAALLLPGARADEEEGPVPPAVQGAVDRGLEWLAKDQQRGGSWEVPNTSGPTVAITGLAAMAFMARGHTPGQGPYGDNLNRAIDFVLHNQHPNGLLAGSDQNHAMYEHGIATVMLCEACGMVDDKRQEQIKAAIGKAVRLILAAQAVPKSGSDRGGWRYKPEDPDSDISVTGWQLMALRGAANVGADVPQRAIDQGIAYIKRRAQSDGGFTYTGGSDGAGGDENAARTGTGVLALELLGQHGAKESIAGGTYLLSHPPGGAGMGMEHYFYSMYYCSQAAYQLGGKYWELLSPTIRSSLIQKQQRDGSWSVSQSTEGQGGTAYGTSMAILALTVPYRYLPIYQR